MMVSLSLILITLLALVISFAKAYDPSPLQDFCVAIDDIKNGDYAPYGQNPPHTHPRATEILVLIERTLYVGFVSSNQGNNRLFAKVLHPDDVFVFPIGQIHFQVNIGKTPAVAFAGLSSQNAGVITIAKTVFGSHPLINPEVFAQAFQLDVNVVKDLEAKF
ncbi:hypothetical protein EUTSA_v10028193mg [Eutrema salsugineum]|uniref:Germin-like protein n=1 Tax=Eutrema salsugineum TaxID=72664 RepID=V4L9N6_EUTSA|nr:hypothetical protein EUTSA_v10028193mg [Eutrema salsugineum]